jgi:predicted small lipoprotein YifL
MAPRSLKVLTVCGIVCLGLGGCGQRGPLTLPGENDATITPLSGDEADNTESSRDEADNDEG